MSTGALVVLTRSIDVERSLGQSDLLKERLAAFGTPVRVVDEPPGRFDIVLQRIAAGGVIPECDVPAGLEEWFAGHFVTSLSSSALVLGVLSLREELVGEVWRHREHGWLVQQPANAGGRATGTWPKEYRDWLIEDYERSPVRNPDDSMDDLRRIATTLDDSATLVVYNVSTYDPAGVHFQLSEDVFTVQAHRFNLGLERVASEMEIAVIDVDRSIAEYGGFSAVEAVATYSQEAGRVVAEDALTAIAELGIEGLSLDADVMRLEVPAYDRRTTLGHIDTWHVAPGRLVRRGEPLFDVTFDNLIHRLDYAADQETNRSMSLTVLAADSGRISDVTVAAGSEVTVGQTVGAVVKESFSEVLGGHRLDDTTPPFRVGIRLK